MSTAIPSQGTFGELAADLRPKPQTVSELLTAPNQRRRRGDTRDRFLDFGFYSFDEAFYGMAQPDELREVLAAVTFSDQGEARAIGHAGSADRLLGDLLLHTGELGRAREHAERGLAWCVEQRAIVEQARCEQLLAEIELADGVPEAALPLLDSAAAIYDRYGLGLYLDQVIAKKEILKA